MKKKHSMILSILLVLLFILTGCCGEQMTATISQDGKCETTIRLMYELSFYETLKEENTTSDTSYLFDGTWKESTEKIGNFTYQIFAKSFSFNSCKELESFFTNLDAYKQALSDGAPNKSAYDEIDYAPFAKATITPELFYAIPADNPSSSDSHVKGGATTTEEKTDENKYYQDQMGIRMDYTVTLPNNITSSNGTINGNTASWTLENTATDQVLIAECGNSHMIASDNTSPVIRGVKNGASYKNPITIYASDETCLQTFTLDNVKLSNIFTTIYEHGKHTAVAIDANHNITTVNFNVDLKKPTIKGAKNGKTYKKKVTLKFIDNTSGIKKITVNKKKIKVCKKKTFKKKGKYTVKVTDNAGNVSILKFKIK